MATSKSTIFWSVILVIAGILIIVGLIRHPSQSEPTPTSSTAISESPTGSPSSSVTSKPKPTPPIGKPVSTPLNTLLIRLTGTVATCNLTGGIDFFHSDLYDNKDSMFSYTGIDDGARLITWTVVPQDDLHIGPNLFNGLKLPDGQSRLSVELPAHPIAKHYDLYAKVTYGRLVNGGLRNYEAQCTGKTSVDLKY